MLDRNKPPFEIVKGREVPALKPHGGQYRAVYPFADMGVGDSFDVEASGSTVKNSTEDSAHRNARSAANMAGRRSGWQFVTRLTSPTTLTIWRVA